MVERVPPALIWPAAVSAVVGRLAYWLIFPVLIVACARGETGETAPGTLGEASSHAVTGSGSSRPVRRPGVEPPSAGTDAIPGFDGNHVRPPAPVMPEVSPGELVLIPAGPFWMGNDEVPDEAPRHQVVLSAYQIERAEVTVGQFKRFIAAGGYEDLSHWSREGRAWKKKYRVEPVPLTLSDEMPVVYVSFYEAEAYAHWAGRRLPTEAEWEKAARGTDGRTFPWGNDSSPLMSHHWLYKRIPMPMSILVWPAASYPRGQSPYGLLHMAGNVWEWTTGYYRGDGYRESEDTASPWRVARGGGWTDLLSRQRTTERAPVDPFDRRSTLGFRCVRDVAGEGP